MVKNCPKCDRKLIIQAGLVEGRIYCPMTSWEPDHYDIFINNLGSGVALYQILKDDIENGDESHG